MGPDRELVTEIRSALAAAACPESGRAAQRYMKSTMPFRGVRMADMRRLVRGAIAEHTPTDRSVWEATIRALWDDAAYREERYAATTLARHRCARAWQDPDALPLYRHLVVTGAWWDLVDEIAGHLVGGILATHRAEVTPVIRAWAVDDDLWIRRTALLCQLRHRDDTDTALLHDVIEANVDDATFWLRKAIGWALRTYAATDPDWVRCEVGLLGDRLSPLSRREALKHLG